MSSQIYQIKVCWYLAGTKGSCHILDMLVVGKTLDDAIKLLKEELTKKHEEYKVDLDHPIIIYEGKSLGYFMYPKLINATIV